MTAGDQLPEPRIIALCGGVGGAKLAYGLAQILPPEDLLIAVNTGDDFEHMGLTICPDLDSVTYTLANLNNEEFGWGRRDESWTVLETLSDLGGETWFRLGDKDIALHLARTQLLARGETLSQVTQTLTLGFGIKHPIIPMSDQPVRTLVETDLGVLPFQTYFVRERCAPTVTRISFQGAENAEPAPILASALNSLRLEGIVICPSNPFVSVDPILSVPGIRKALLASNAPVIAVSPIIAGAAVKGPTAKIMTELGLESSAVGVAHYYGSLLDGYILDVRDRDEVDRLAKDTFRVICTNTLMKCAADKIHLAEDTVKLLGEMVR